MSQDVGRTILARMRYQSKHGLYKSRDKVRRRGYSIGFMIGFDIQSIDKYDFIVLIVITCFVKFRLINREGDKRAQFIDCSSAYISIHTNT